MKTISITLLFITYAMLPAFAFSEEYSTDIQEKIYSIQQTMRKDLSEGHTDRARNKLEQAAGNFHAVEIELGLIQTLMQAGEYRHALSAAAHTQAEHPDTIDSTLLYAWLLAIGGQTTPAMQLIETTLEHYPDNNSLQLMQQQIKTHQLFATDLTTSTAIQLKPFTTAKLTTLKLFNYLTTGVVINNGRQVLTNLMGIEKAKTLHVRNGLGREMNARIAQKIPTANLAVLILDQPFKNTTTLNLANKTAFPGVPIYIIGFSPQNHDQADWPQLKVDILGTPTADTNNINAGYPIHIQGVAMGSGVFNLQGNLIGIVGEAENKTMTPLADILNAYKKSPNRKLTSGKLPMDEIYENALSNVVQVLGSN